MSTKLCNVEAEREVLADLISDENTYTALAPEVSADLFTDDACRKCYAIIEQLAKEGKVPELTEVGMRLVTQGLNLTDFVSMANNSFTITKQRVGLLKELAYRRRSLVLHQRAINLLTDPKCSVEEYTKTMTEIERVGEEATPSGGVAIKDTIHDLLTDVANRMQGNGNMGIATGLHIYDVRHGFHEGDLVIIAAETSQGKSTLASTMAYNMAIAGVPVVYYSLEMGAKQLTARIAAKGSGLPSTRTLYDQHISQKEFNELDNHFAELAGLPIYFDDASKTSFTKICSSIRAMVRKKGIKVAFVDYLQILANGKQENREGVIGDMARDLKRLAVELGICIVALSQLCRDGNNHEPSLARLRGSGQVAEASDIVTLIYRPEVYGIATHKHHSTAGLAELTIAKGRNIGLGQEFVKFNGELSYFEDSSDLPTTTTKEKDPWED